MDKKEIVFLLKDIEKELFISKEAGIKKIEFYRNDIKKQNKKINE